MSMGPVVRIRHRRGEEVIRDSFKTWESSDTAQLKGLRFAHETRRHLAEVEECESGLM